MAQQERLRGIFTPNLVPQDSSGEINEAELRRYVDWLIARGVHGLYPNGSTGEFTRFRADERRRITEIIADQTKGRVPILAGAAEAKTPAEIKATAAEAVPGGEGRVVGAEGKAPVVENKTVMAEVFRA